MQKLIDYIAQYDSAYPGRIKGASEAEINELEVLVREKLPDIYRSYLAYMGHDDGGLDIADNGSSRIEDIKLYYETYVVTGRAYVPRNCVVICEGLFPEQEIVLEVLKSEDGYRVYFAQDYDLLELYATSFEKLLFRDAFLTMRANKNAYKMFASNNHRERQLETAVKFAEDLGCQFQWFSDSGRSYGERSNLTIQLSQLENSGLYVGITTDDYEELKQIYLMFEKQFYLIY